MTREENTKFMKDFFEKYYEQLKAENDVLVAGVKIPEEMVAYELTMSKGWSVWKLIPSTVKDEDFKEIEDNWGIKFPDCIKAFFCTYHHRFDDLLGKNLIGKPFETLELAYNPNLTANGYLPFGWDSDNYFIRCIDLTNTPDDEKCPVVQIDHETLFDLGDEYEDDIIPKEEIEENIEWVADNFYEYLNAILNGDIE